MDERDIAIIGFAGRFPGADSAQQFWHNIAAGVESVSFLSEDEIRSCGIPPSTYERPDFIKAVPVLSGAEEFDAEFFGYSPREALLLDPQHRLFLECVWSAVESAGYSPDLCPGTVGVFAGTSLSSYMLYHLLPFLGHQHAEDVFQAMVGNDKDFLCTRVSYKFDWRGPSITVQTGCSTSLVALHLACQALHTLECDLAIAGGVSVQVPCRRGYIFQEGGVQAPDGHCRPFDEQAGGTLFGSGVGAVVLKRAADAVNDRDTIYAVVKGTAINNDGRRKLGFTAPSVEGQFEAIRTAMAFGEVAPETVEYVECHGTGTLLGDPIEAAALKRAFAGSGEHYCAIGSVKANIGHLDAAAGIAGVIKVALALTHKYLPPSVNYSRPNPKLELTSSPFYINTEGRRWDSRFAARRAGVSSFGIGGTNAHAVLEEAPNVTSGPSRVWQFLPLSAKTSAALERQTHELASWLETRSDISIADAAYTLQVGRSVFSYRTAVVGRDRNDLIHALRTGDASQVFTDSRTLPSAAVVFMFPGGGAQHTGMGSDLYRSEPVFRGWVDKCAQYLDGYCGRDYRQYFLDSALSNDSHMRETDVALPTLFIAEVAMAHMLIAWGIKPAALIGHSLGEYVAAYFSGVLSLEDALTLVVVRSQLMKTLPSGKMLSVSLPESDVRQALIPGVSIAAVNAPGQVVVAGDSESVDNFAERLARGDVEYRAIPIDVASHCHLVNGMSPAFTSFLKTLTFRTPTIPYISNVTGKWMAPDQPRTPEYWNSHLRETVRFSDGVRTLSESNYKVFIEVGPGHSLTAACKVMGCLNDALLINAMRHQYDRRGDGASLIAAIAQLWVCGICPDWMQFYNAEHRGRVPLPTYAFQRRRYFVEQGKQRQEELWSPTAPAERIDSVSRWFYVPTWRETQALPLSGEERPTTYWVISLGGEESVWHKALCRRLGRNVLSSIVADEGACDDGGSQCDPQDFTNVREVVRRHYRDGNSARHIVCVLNSHRLRTKNGLTATSALKNAFYGVLFLIQALAEERLEKPIDVWIVADGVARLDSQDGVIPEVAAILGLCRVVHQENAFLRCHLVDVGSIGSLSEPQCERLSEMVVAELERGTMASPVVFRNGSRWVQEYQRLSVDGCKTSSGCLKNGGVYLLVGGLGRVGLFLAERMAAAAQIKLILTCKSHLPAQHDWEPWICSRGETDPISAKIARVMQLRGGGTEVLALSVDVANVEQMNELFRGIRDRFGRIDGIIHLAGITGAHAVEPIACMTPRSGKDHFAAKLEGTRVLLDIAAQLKELDFLVLFSSSASIIGGAGLGHYAASNAVLDALGASHRYSDCIRRVLSINWDRWLLSDVGGSSRLVSSLDALGMSPEEGAQAFFHLLSSGANGQVIVSTADLERRISLWSRPVEAQLAKPIDGAYLYTRPQLRTDYTAPSSNMEQAIAKIWSDFLKIADIGRNDNFFDLGGTSVLAIRIVAEMSQKLGVDVSVVSLFENPTVATMASLMRATEGQKQESSCDIGHSRGKQRRALVS